MSNSWQHLNGIKEWYDSSFTAICISGIRSHGGPSEEDFSTTSLIPTCKLWTNASICYLVCRFSLCVSFISVRLLHSFANVPNLTVKRKQSAKLLFVCLFFIFGIIMHLKHLEVKSWKCQLSVIKFWLECKSDCVKHNSKQLPICPKISTCHWRWVAPFRQSTPAPIPSPQYPTSKKYWNLVNTDKAWNSTLILFQSFAGASPVELSH